MNILCLTWADYECQENFYFEAPEGTTEGDFQGLCNSLLSEAAQEACRLGGNTWGYIPEDAETRDPTWVGWSTIVHVLAHKLLPARGYKQVQLPTVCYAGTTIIRDKEYDDAENLLKQEAFDIIAAHNQKVSDRLDTYHQQLRQERQTELECSSERVEKEMDFSEAGQEQEQE